MSAPANLNVDDKKFLSLRLADELGLITEAIEQILEEYQAIENDLLYRKFGSILRILKKHEQSNKKDHHV